MSLCRQRKDSGIDLSDFINSQKHDIDSTGLVCKYMLLTQLGLH
jgi:hypothetical protein